MLSSNDCIVLSIVIRDLHRAQENIPQYVPVCTYDRPVMIIKQRRYVVYTVRCIGHGFPLSSPYGHPPRDLVMIGVPTIPCSSPPEGASKSVDLGEPPGHVHEIDKSRPLLYFDVA